MPAPATAPTQPGRRHAVFHELSVAAIEPLTDDAVALTFAVPSELRDDYRFIQGQHLTIRCTQAGDDLRRNYSICTPAGSGLLRIGVKRLPGGVFSAYALSRLRVGERIEVMTPTGNFHIPLDPDSRRSYLAIAAGSGITPILSIVATTLAVEPRSQVTLLAGNRSTRDIMFLEELCDLKNRHPARLAVHHVLSREPGEVELLSGRLDADHLARFLDTLVPPEAVDHCFLCGPPAMIDASRALLVERGVDPSCVHTELFHAEGTPAPGLREATSAAGAAGRAEVTILLDGRASTFSMPREGETVLDAALRVRPDAPYACTGGVCGTCRAHLVDGEVRMDRCHALGAAEREAGLRLTCQSHPVSERVTLDYDC